MKKLFFFITLVCVNTLALYAQGVDSIRIQNERSDSIYIAITESKKGRPKVLHAEPLYIDLIRDLGARKGEKEWNFATGIQDNIGFDEIKVLAEYEFAPIDRLGLEIEMPFNFYSPQKGVAKDSIAGSGLESLKLAGQWSFFVSEKMKTSFALGYIHEFTTASFREMPNQLFKGHVLNPFFVGAKRWGQNFHTLLYTGPWIERERDHHVFRYDVNTSFHYMIPGTRNFVGVEINKSIERQDFDMVLRPQMRVGIAHNLLVGIVGGIPVSREHQRFSMFTRLIWEPGEKKH